MRHTLARLKQWAHAIKRDVIALWLAARDPRTPWIARAVAALVAAYALSPIDLIPDFIPILGYLDDAVLLPLGVLLVFRLIPSELMAEFRAAALEARPPASRLGAAAIVAAWVLSAAVLAWLFWPENVR